MGKPDPLTAVLTKTMRTAKATLCTCSRCETERRIEMDLELLCDLVRRGPVVGRNRDVFRHVVARLESGGA